MSALLLRVVANFIAVIIAASVLTGYVGYGSLAGVVVFAVVLALLNTFVKPLLQVLTFPLGCLTLGLFVLVINAFLFWLAAQVSGGQAVQVSGAGSGAVGAFLGALIVSLVSIGVARWTR